MQQQGFNRIASRRILSFAVQGHTHSLGHIRCRVDKEMTNAIGMAEHGNSGVVLNEADQRIASPRNDQIHQAIEAQQRQAFLTGGQQGEGIRGTGLAASPAFSASITASLVQRASLRP